LTLDVFNIGNRKVNDIQYFYELHKLSGESGLPRCVIVRQTSHCGTPKPVHVTLRSPF